MSRAYFNWTALSHDFQSCRKCRQIVIRSAFLATIIRSLYRDAVRASIMECASQQRRGHTWSGACPNGAQQIMGRKITMFHKQNQQQLMDIFICLTCAAFCCENTKRLNQYINCSLFCSSWNWFIQCLLPIGAWKAQISSMPSS